MKILIIEDDDNLISILKNSFEEENYIVDCATNGNEGQYLATLNQYDVIVVDWMLPNISGIELISNIRKNNIQTPIIMLTAKNEIKDKINGLKTGADDYLSKPFSLAELQARVEALYRRSFLKNSNKIFIKNIIIEVDKKRVFQNNNEINLSAKEYELLIFLVKNKNSYISKYMIEEQLYNNEEFINSNVIEVTIFNLRKKLSKDLIQNFRGLGYKIET